MFRTILNSLQSVLGANYTRLPSNGRQREVWIKGKEFDYDRTSWQPHRRKEPTGVLAPFTLISWNVDAAAPDSKQRLSLSIKLIKERLDDEGKLAVICLQEVHRDALQALYEDPWIQNEFIVIQQGSLRYDAVTLVSSQLTISGAFVVDFPTSAMGRRAIFVDLEMISPIGAESILLRVANTHLESMNQVQEREHQLRITANYVAVDGIHFGAICGDMNANHPHDHSYPPDIGLLDVWSDLRGNDDGITWGHQQDISNAFPVGRFDKVFVYPCEKPAFYACSIIVVEGKYDGEQGWLSDHHALVATFQPRLP